MAKTVLSAARSLLILLGVGAGFVSSGARAVAAPPEVRGVWLTTTGNDATATPARTAETMLRLREIGLNTVYVEAWKNGYTQYPSKVLERVIGVDRRPDLAAQGAGEHGPRPARDLLEEAAIEAHRNGLVCVAWFGYGLIAAHKDAENHLRAMYPHWLSRDQSGSEVAPDGFVWLNPLHPECRRFLLDLILEAVDRYDLDGVQLDDRIAWPYYTMGYDDYSIASYRNEHGGQSPPDDPKDAGWMRWRAEKSSEFARQIVEEIRNKRPGVIVSLSPAPYPWCYENHLLEWPKWAASIPGNDERAWWDEFVPQCYRYDRTAFGDSWNEQVQNLHAFGAGERIKDMLAGTMIVGSRPEPVPWEDLRQSIEHVRATGGGGHVWWPSQGVLDVYPTELAGFYALEREGPAPHPDHAEDWRPAPIPLTRQILIAETQDRESDSTDGTAGKRASVWRGKPPPGTYIVVVRRGGVRGAHSSAQVKAPEAGSEPEAFSVEVPADADAVELLRDRRPAMNRAWKPAR